jgi:starch-binding outer membrane protein, SusD/RagB family
LITLKKYKMKNKFLKSIALFACTTLLVTSCAKRLELVNSNDLVSTDVYKTAAGYKSVLAKLYGTLAITGNQGPAGSPDIAGGLDEGSQVPFIRGFFNCQELPTEEAIVAWDDQTIKDFHGLKWTSSDPFIQGIYARCIYDVTLINEYLRESEDSKVAGRGIVGVEASDIKKSRAEARFLRAFNYWVMMDIFGKSTFITEADGIGAFLPMEKKRADLFVYIESELKAIDADLLPVRTIEYGRVDQGAAWALLARMYLNAKVYTGIERSTDAITYAKKVIAAGYALQPNYRQLFMADNDKRANEFMFAINCDGARTQAYGNTTFIVHAACDADHDEYGVGGGWGGYRATKGLADLFTDLSGNTDKRAMFTTSSFNTSASQIAIPNTPTAVGTFTNGLHVKKFVNLRSDGNAVNDPNRNFCDIDFPVFRLPEMYLIYAEGFLRGGTGADATTALGYINAIRTRSGASTISAPAMNLQFILDERGRELYWEGHRRTDLVRYGLLTTGTYVWPWKGNVAGGTGVDEKYNLFPIPAVNRNSNPNLTQNIGY